MRRILVLGVCVMGLMVAASALFSAEWPGWHGPSQNVISPEKGINKDWKANAPKLLWRIDMHDAGHAGPAIADGKVFIIDHQGEEDAVLALDINTGKDVWLFKYADSGTTNYGFTRSTPLVDGDKVYTVSMLGNVYCLDMKKGTEIWHKSLVADFGGRLPEWKMAVSPVVDGDKLILCPGGDGASVIAVKKDTGDLVWKGGGSDLPGYATPVIATLAGKKQYVVFTSAACQGVDAADGKVLWRFPWKTQYDVNAPTPLIVGGDRVFITSDYNRGCAMLEISADGVKKAWENKNITAHFSSPLFFQGHIYGTTDPGRLVCLDPKTGDALWKQKGFEKGGIVGVEGMIIAQDGQKGDLVLVEMSPAGYKELGRIDAFPGCRERAWAAPIVGEGKLVARDLKSLACFDLK